VLKVALSMINLTKSNKKWPQHYDVGYPGSDAMVSMLASSAVDRWFKSRLGQTKDYEIGICCFPTKHASIRRKSKDWLARNRDNMSWVGHHVYPRNAVPVS
jgi:hypothetical protein